VGRVTKANVDEGMNHGETVKTVADDIDSKGGYESYKDSAPEDLAAVLREMESKMAAPVTSSTRAAEGIVDTLGEMTATQLSRDLQALATKAPTSRPTIMGEDAAVRGPREMTDEEFAFHNLITSDEPTTMAGIVKARRLEKEKTLHFEERGKLAELEARRNALLHQEKHPDAPKDLPWKLKEVNRAITKIERKIEAFPKDLEKAIKREQIKGGAKEPEVTLSKDVHRFMDNKNLWGTVLVGGSGIAVMTEEESDGLFKAGLGPTLLALAAAGAGVSGARALKASRKVFHVRDVEVIRNPTPRDRRQIKKEVRSEFGRDPSGDPETRFTNDAAGNTWIWKSADGGHEYVEPLISKHEGVTVSQNALRDIGKLTAKAPARAAKAAQPFKLKKRRAGFYELVDDEGRTFWINKQSEHPKGLPWVGDWGDNVFGHRGMEPIYGKSLKEVKESIKAYTRSEGHGLPSAKEMRESQEYLSTRMAAPSKLKQTAIPSLLVAGAGAAVVTDEGKEYMSKADLSSIITLLALGGVGAGLAAKRFRNIREVRYLNRNPKARKEAIENIPRDKTTGQTRQEEVVAESMQETGLYKDRGYWGEVLDDAFQVVGDALSPMSRSWKKISLMLTRVMRDHEKDVSVVTAKYLARAQPFVIAMSKAIGKNQGDLRQLKIALLNGDHEKLKPLLTKYNNAVRTILRKDFKLNGGADAAYITMRNALNEVRSYARERGGYDVGYQENYFPRHLKNYKAFRRFMTEHKGWDELQNEIDLEIQRYADRSYDGNAGIVPEGERAEIASRVLRGGSGAGQAGPSNVKQRKIRLLDEQMVDAYDDPAAALKEYVSKVVTASERRAFLGGVDSMPLGREVTVDVGLTEVKDVMMNDLGLKADARDAIGGYVERHSREMGLSVDEAATLKKLVTARFNAKGVSASIGAVKSANYLATLGNFGAALTQLSDAAYAIHFNGLGPTFKAMFGKHNEDWFKRFGLGSKDIDMQASKDGLSKLLHTTLKLVGFTKLDKFGKNVVMNSTFHRMQKEAVSNPSKLMAELEPMYGKEITSQIIKDFKGGRFTPDVESVIWYKLSDLQPISLTEMPIGYATSGNMRLAYMLKSFTIKQFDVFMQADKGKIEKTKRLWRAGKKEEAVKTGGQAIYNIAALATVFGGANAGTSVLKDTIFGREINPEELTMDTMWRLFGISRYNVWQARREGLGKAAVELFLPPTAFIDRASKDLMSLAEGKASGEIFKGIGLGDFYYWHYGGGREKTRKAIAKKYGIKLENVPK